MEGTTKKDIEGLLNSKKYSWLRSQKNRRILVVFYALLLLLIALGSFYQEIKEWFAGESIIPLIALGLISLLWIIGYSLLRVSVRGLAEAPDELLDERQIGIRNSNYRYSYIILSYLALIFAIILNIAPENSESGSGITVDFAFIYISFLITLASLPSMVVAWRERDI